MSSSDSNQPESKWREGEAERFDPRRDGPELAYEHVHRYLLAGKVLGGLCVLDLASGSGYGTRLLESAGCRVTALDLDSSGLRGGGPAICADARRLPLRDASFDAVVCFEAIEHVDDPEALVDEVRRVLRGRSIFIVSTPDRSIYTDRAGHENPYHLTEMSRSEFTALLDRHFEYVQISGQGLWAGSWITALARDGPEEAPSPGLKRRKVDPARWHSDKMRASEKHAKWASPEADELPSPVYLVAACSNSTTGWNRIKRRLSADSILHDSSQWLLAQYERLIQERTAGDHALEGQIDLARVAQGDLKDQLEAARTRIDQHDAETKAARASMGLLEKEIRNSREVADRQADELRRAGAAADDQERQLSLARVLHDDLQGQLKAAARASADHEQEIVRARVTIDEKMREVSGAATALAQAENELSEARNAIDQQRLELARAASGAKALESHVEAAGVARVDLEAQLQRVREESEAAREELAEAQSSIGDFENEVATARRGAASLERQIADAKSALDDKEAEIELARRAATAQQIEIEALHDRTRTAQEEIEVLQTRSNAAHSRIDDLERARARFFVRVGHQLADRVDRLRGRNP